MASGSDVHCKSGNISATVQDRDIVDLLVQIANRM